MNLVSLRRKIDKIDEKIVELLNERAEMTLIIKKIKKKTGQNVYAPHREKQIYENLTRRNKGPMPDESLCAIYREIMSASLSLGRPVKVAYLGPPLTFTHLSAIKKFGSSVEYVSCDGIGEVFKEVEKGRADYGVVPIENSIEGAVSYTFDMFVDSTLKICSEIYLEVTHNLLSKYSAKKIKLIYSHPQVFAQCRNWLEKNMSRAELIEVYSTSKAAELCSRRKNTACIASILAAQRYGLRVIAGSIEDTSHNVTRFLVIGKSFAVPTKKDKTSIVFSIKDRVGALHDILVPFKKNGINLTKIESRPSKLKAWEYYFFVDIEGHYYDQSVKKALKSLERNTTYLKVLGSYPAGK